MAPFNSSSPQWLSYLAALALLALATALRAALDPLLQGYGILVTYFAVPMLAAWLLGTGPALVGLLGGLLLGAFLFAHPRGSLWMAEVPHWTALGVYLLANLAIIPLIRSLGSKGAQLQRSEHQLQRLLRTSYMGIGLLDARGRLHHANPALSKMIDGGKRGSVISAKAASTLLPPSFADRMRESRPAAGLSSPLAPEYAPYETEYVGDDGRRVPLLVALLPFEHPTMPAVVGAIFVTDLSPIKQAQDVLRFSEERMRLAAQASGLGWFDVDLQTREGFYSPEFKKIFGLAPDAPVEIDADWLPAQIHPDDRAGHCRAARAALDPAGPGELQDEHRIIRPDGSVRWVFVKSRVFFTGEGGTRQPVRVIGAVLDITERKATDQALRENEKKYRELLENLYEGIWLIDRDDITTFVNSKMAEMLGYSIDEMLGRSLYNFMEEPAKAIAKHNLDLGRQGIKALYDFDFRRKDGSALATRIATSPLHDEAGHYRGALAGVVDNSTRRQMEDALRQREFELKEAQRIARLGSWEWTIATDTVVWSEQLYRMYGLDPASPAPGYREHERLYTPESFQRLDAAVRRCLQYGDRYELDLELVRPDGTHRWAVATGEAKCGATGHIVGLRGTALDITERRAAEQALRESEAKLRVQTEELAVQGLRKDEFIATLAHELRNPLAPIRNALEIVKRTPDRDSVLASVKAGERQVAQLVRLVDDLLDISRITRGKITLHKQRVTLQAVVETALETSQPYIDAGGHALSVEIPPEPVLLDADPTRLAQALSNLLVNATKFTAPGGQIRLLAYRRPEQLTIAVQDSGMGIEAAMLPRVFDLFTQIEPPGTLGRGLGIGLALVRSLVELHGGQVEAASPGLGRGATFTIHLPMAPLAETPEAPAQPQPRVALPSQAARRILVVDDDSDVAYTTAALLETLGHEVQTADNGASAIRLALEQRPDVVLLDIGLPDMDGYEVARRLRAEPLLRGLRLIAVTGWGQEKDRRKSRNAGFDAHLVKPVDPGRLDAIVREGAAAPIEERARPQS